MAGSVERFRFRSNFTQLFGRIYNERKLTGLPGEFSAWASVDSSTSGDLKPGIRMLGICTMSLAEDGRTEIYDSLTLFEQPGGKITAQSMTDIVPEITDRHTPRHVTQTENNIPENHESLAIMSALVFIEQLIETNQVRKSFVTISRP